MQFSAYSNPPTSHQKQDHLNIPQYIIELTRNQSIYYSVPYILLLTFKVKFISGTEGFTWLDKHTIQIQKYKFPSNLSSHIQAFPTSFSQFSSVAQSCPTPCDPMNRSTPGLPVHHQLPEFTQTHVHRLSDAIQSSHPLSSPSPPAPNPSQHQGLFQ